MPLKNSFIKILVSSLKSKRNAARPQDNRFLIVSTTALGDTLWGTPAIKALRETYPDSYIAALTSPIGKEILLHNPHIDEIFLLKNPALPSLLSLYGTLKKRHFSHAFIFHTSQRPVLPCVAMLSPPMIIGSKDINKGLDFLLTHCFATDGKTHEIQRRLQLVSQVGAYPSTCDMELFLHPEDERIACQWLDSLSLPAYLPRIAFHPGAKDAFKQWPASHFIALGQRLSSHLGCAIFVTGTPAEKALVEQIASGIPGAISATHLPLRAFAALIKKMNVMVANDTGPMHVAFAMKTPTVALFAPTDPALCGPYRINSATIIAKPPTCQPCLRRKCPYSFCLLQIGVQEVYDATLRMFYGAR